MVGNPNLHLTKFNCIYLHLIESADKRSADTEAADMPPISCHSIVALGWILSG